MRAVPPVLLVVILLTQGGAGEPFLFPQNDAGSGADAGDDLADAYPLGSGNYAGTLQAPFDFADFYSVTLVVGEWLAVRVEAPPSLGCVSITFFDPAGEAYGVQEDCWQNRSFGRVVAPRAGAWSFLLSPRGLSTEPVTGDYSFEVFAHRLEQGSGYSFSDARWVATRFDGPAQWANLQLNGSNTSEPVRSFLVYDDGAYESWGTIGIPHALWEPGSSLSVRANDVHHELPLVDLGEVLWKPPSSALLMSTPVAGPAVVVSYFGSPVSGSVGVGWSGSANVTFHSGQDLTLLRMSDFNSDLSLHVPLIGAAINATRPVFLSKHFLGFFHLSPALAYGGPLGIDPSDYDLSEGGYTNPAGETFELGQAGGNRSVAFVYPMEGTWQFWFRRDAGVHGNPVVVEGVALPPELYVQRRSTAQNV